MVDTKAAAKEPFNAASHVKSTRGPCTGRKKAGPCCFLLANELLAAEQRWYTRGFWVLAPVQHVTQAQLKDVNGSMTASKPLLLTPYVALSHSPTEGWVPPVLLGAWADRHDIHMTYEQGRVQVSVAALPGEQVGEATSTKLLNFEAVPHLWQQRQHPHHSGYTCCVMWHLANHMLD
jgi:hypothetical protein